MSISVTCANCRKVYHVDASLAGRQVRCKACEAIISIPVTGTLAPPAAPPPAVPMPAPRRPDSPPPAAPSIHNAPRTMRRPAPPRSLTEGFRVNMPYEEGFIAILDTSAVIAGQGGFWLVTLIFAMLEFGAAKDAIHMAGQRSLPVVVLVFLLGTFPAVYLAWSVVFINLCHLSDFLTGMMFHFELPEEPRWRIISANVCSGMYAVIGWICYFLYTLTTTQSPPTALLDANQTFPLIALITLPLAIPSHFFLTWLVLRIKFHEALVAWLLHWLSAGICLGLIYALRIAAIYLLPRFIT